MQLLSPRGDSVKQIRLPVPDLDRQRSGVAEISIRPKYRSEEAHSEREPENTLTTARQIDNFLIHGYLNGSSSLPLCSGSTANATYFYALNSAYIEQMLD
jgi:hypothetical protein